MSGVGFHGIPPFSITRESDGNIKLGATSSGISLDFVSFCDADFGYCTAIQCDSAPVFGYICDNQGAWMSSSNKMDYKSAGVDVEAGDALVDWLQTSASENPSGNKKAAYQDHIVSGIGGFASLFRFQFPQYKKPCLVTCTDGVGTKVKIASHYRRMGKVGQDLVAMCVNDLVCTGGRPLLFLDYFATGKLDLDDAKSFLQSVREACAESECALVGGETAEMPGVYAGRDFDCAGFAVGIVDEDEAWGPAKVQESDCLIGVASSGFHSNGYSLLRRVFANDMDAHVDELLKPTALYVRMCLELSELKCIHAAAHITGGGLENIPRVLPQNLRAKLKKWEFSDIYREVQKRTGMSDLEKMNTLNCGLGFVLVTPQAHREQVLEIAKRHHHAWELGSVVACAPGENQIQIENS